MVPLFDDQYAIGRYLEGTVTLLGKAAEACGGSPGSAYVRLLPSLGLPDTTLSAWAGFYTGAYYSWDPAVSMVPVDAMVGSRRTTLVELAKPIRTAEAFYNACSATHDALSKRGIIWLDNESVEIIYAREPYTETPGYLVITMPDLAQVDQPISPLAPTPDCFYFNAIQSVEDQLSKRSMRYIANEYAERYFELVQEREQKSLELHRSIILLLAPNQDTHIVVSNVEDGMPTRHSLAIGCSWIAAPYVLRTGKNQDIFLLQPRVGGENVVSEDNLMVFPCSPGQGLSTRMPTITYSPQGLVINGKVHDWGDMRNTIPNTAERILGDTDISAFGRFAPSTVLRSLQPLLRYP